MIDYERLEVYKCSLEFVRQTISLREIVSKGNGDLIDQFRRASFSVVLMSLFHLCSLINDQQIQIYKNLLHRIVAMLSEDYAESAIRVGVGKRASAGSRYSKCRFTVEFTHDFCAGALIFLEATSSTRHRDRAFFCCD